MTTVNEDTGRILWSTESKYFLLRLIKENSIIISPDVSADTMTKKEEAWVGIEETFAADGMPCQLSKLKRLWKRMKDTARQNLLKFNALKKQTDNGQPLSIQQANVKAPTELDLEVADLIARRNLHKKNSRRNKSSANKTRASSVEVKFESPAAAPTSLDDYNSFEEHLMGGGGGGGAEQHHHHHHLRQQNGYHDALEPVTILEEFDQSRMEDDGDEDDVAMMASSSSQRTPPSAAINTERLDTKQLQSVLMLHEIKLRELQRQNEQERMDNERELFRKQSKLLDLQIKKATMELSTISRQQTMT